VDGAGRAAQFAETVLAALRTGCPYAEPWVWTGGDDGPAAPQERHPAFHGCYDWHSAVHMVWSGVRIVDDLPPGYRRDALLAELDTRLAPEALGVETDFLERHRGFERPYGWAWLVALAAAAAQVDHPAWAAALRPAANLLLTRFKVWLPRLHYPVRHGVHSNTAFALARVRAAGDVLGDGVAGLIDERSRAWFGADRDAPVQWEPGGSDFLSPSLTEADLMRGVLGDEFPLWLEGFLPRLGSSDDPLLVPPIVSDPTDGQGAHLLGLALSRAGQLRRLASVLPEARAGRVRRAADRMVDLAEPHISDGDFMATHWLVSFALLADDE